MLETRGYVFRTLQHSRRYLYLPFLFLAGQVGVLLVLDRDWFCSCGSIRLWQGVLDPHQNSQQLTDHYSLLQEESRYVSERGAVARRAEIKVSGDFHLLLASMSGNPILERFMDELIARSSLVIALHGRSGTSSCGHREHLAILDALERRDDQETRELMLHHIDHIEADLDLQARSTTRLRDALLR